LILIIHVFYGFVNVKKDKITKKLQIFLLHRYSFKLLF